MKPTKLIIKNIGKVANETILIDKPLILFYGEIKQGKTTILKSVRWVCGGEFPADIIRHGEKEGEIELHFDGGMIARSFYRAKDGTTKARAVTFVKAGRPVSQPVAEIKRFLNPFLLDQDFLRNKTELERKQYFTELFAVDTTALDTELFNNQREATALRAKIGGYGEIDLMKVEAVDASALKSELTKIRGDYASKKADLEKQLQALATDYESRCVAIDLQNDGIRDHNAKRGQLDGERAGYSRDIQRFEAEIAAAQKRIKELIAKRDAIQLPEVKELLPRPTPPDRAALQQAILDIQPDTTELEAKIQNAAAQNVRAEQYAANKKRSDAKTADESALAALEKRAREIKSEKQTMLQSIGDSCGIPGLSFDETGNFIYDGTTAGMISDSQIMRLSSELSALYPEGFGLDLIDRAESLGKSIFDFVDRAKAEKKSILATIVGEKPAKVPADVGVFVVEEGKLL